MQNALVNLPLIGGAIQFEITVKTLISRGEYIKVETWLEFDIAAAGFSCKANASPHIIGHEIAAGFNALMGQFIIRTGRAKGDVTAEIGLRRAAVD